ncbi:cytochrome c1 [Brevundimonas sp.]|uniref:cytochrome c1 n=1 Tax=Brevundimonas sp. TaxID=1871086 RepID=UPI0025FFCAEC|nr:cytochrome c1 [Brevundimonas sp.]
MGAGAVQAEGGALHPRNVDYSFEGPFGTFDQGQLQRGYRVYEQVCAACHSMNLMSYRNLGQEGGPFYSEEHPNPNDNPYVKAIAAQIEVGDLDTETGEPIMRAATPADRFRSPFPNATAAAFANGGAAPPDLSVITKARHGGAEYVYSLLTGYREPPAGLRIGAGQHYNAYMAGDLSPFWDGDSHHVPPGGFIAMAPPLMDGAVTYDDGTEATVDQMAQDVAAFLAWASDPHQVERKKTGLVVLIYLLGFAVLTWFSYRRIWRNVAH